MAVRSSWRLALQTSAAEFINRWKCNPTLGAVALTIIIKHLKQTFLCHIFTLCLRCNTAPSSLSGNSIVPWWQGNLFCHVGCRVSGIFPLNQILDHFDSILWFNLDCPCLLIYSSTLLSVRHVSSPDQNQRYADIVNRQALATGLIKGVDICSS